MAPSFLNQSKEKFNFVALFITIALGVAAGNLTSNWITAKVVEYQDKQALIEFSKEAERAADRTSQKLAQACQEWRKADSDLKSNNPNELSYQPHVPIRNRLVSVLGWRMAAR